MPQNDAIVEFIDVTVHRGGRIALDSVNLKLPPGKLLGLIGPNGAGKTTLLEVILGEIDPEAGSVLIDGIPHKDALKSGFRIGYLPQEHSFDRHIPITALQAVVMARYGSAGLFKRPNASDRAIAMDALESVDAADIARRNVGEISGGQIQRVFIARALAAHSRLLLLDEPEAGVDVETSDRFMRLLAELRDKFGLATILVSHDIGMITRHADIVACLNRRLFFHDTPISMTGEAIEYTFGKECELLIHDVPMRFLKGHDD